MDETPVKEFIKSRQKERLVPKGTISIQNVKSNFINQKSAYSVFKCKVKPLFGKVHYLMLILTSDGKIKEFQGDEYTDFDEWDSFKF